MALSPFFLDFTVSLYAFLPVCSEINNNLSGTKITVDILSDALNAGDGIHEYNLNGSSYTGNLPEPNYAYGNGTVYRRNKSSITVVLYGGTQEPIATNYSSDGKTWRGWKVHALKSDLDASVKTTNLSAGKDVRLFVGELNGSQNYLQFLIDGVDKGYIVFDVSRNINT